jgi:hypothetical protein
MDKKKLDEIEEAADRIMRLAQLLKATSPIMRTRMDKIFEDARMVAELTASLKSED